MQVRKIIFVIIFALMAVSAEKELPPDFTRCHQNDPKLNDCLRKAVPEALRKMKDGIPSLSVPPMEPLLISGIEIKSGAGPVVITQSYRNIKLHGLTDSTLTTYKADLKRFRLRTDSLTPKMEFVGDYVMSGRVLVLPIQGKGVANITMGSKTLDDDAGMPGIALYDRPSTRLAASGMARMAWEACREPDVFPVVEPGKPIFDDKAKIKGICLIVNLVVKHDLIGEKVDKDGQVFMHLKDYKVKFIPQRVVMHFTNLFNGDERLGKQMNAFLNENWELVFNELKQSYEDSLSSVFKDVSNQIFDNVPMNKIFLED